jgi:hypothetical protein
MDVQVFISKFSFPSLHPMRSLGWRSRDWLAAMLIMSRRSPGAAKQVTVPAGNFISVVQH